MPSASVQSSPCEVAVGPVMCVTLPQSAVAALWRGQVIEAVKLVRSEHNIGLKEAKEHVEAYVQTQPALRTRIIQAQADAREGFLRWLIFLLVGGAGIAFFLA